MAGVRPHDPVSRALQASGAARPRRHLHVYAEERRQGGRRPAGAVRVPPRRRAGPPGRRRVHRRPAREDRPFQEGVRWPCRAVRRPRRAVLRRRRRRRW